MCTTHAPGNKQLVCFGAVLIEQDLSAYAFDRHLVSAFDWRKEKLEERERVWCMSQQESSRERRKEESQFNTERKPEQKIANRLLQ